MKEVHRNKQFGDLLRTFRIRKGMTQIQLAGLSTISVRAIRDLELGRTRPRQGTTQLIADGLGLTGRDRADFDTAAGHAVVTDAFELIRNSEHVRPPASLNAIVGRESEASMLADMLVSGRRRLVTITGVPGVGKSRLALRVAEILYRSHGIPVLWTTPPEVVTPYRMAAAQDQLSHLIRHTLDGLFDAEGDSAQQLSSLIGDQPVVLVLDGCDGSRAHSDHATSLLQKSHGLRMLRTARTTPDIPEEQTSPLSPLTVPEFGLGHSPAQLAEIPSVQVLVSHIRLVRPEFTLTVANARAIAEICWRLDGIPAALEMAASWLLACEPEDLLTQVRSDPFSVIHHSTRDGGLSHLGKTLGAVLGSLPPDERLLMEHLISARSSMSVSEAAEASGIPAPTCLALIRRLLMHGLLVHEDGSTKRFRTLNLIHYLQDCERSHQHFAAAPFNGAMHEELVQLSSRTCLA
ncbi:AAA family ATPase [Nonomuraea angiospora]